MVRYCAIFSIHGGVSPGFGIRYPDQYKHKEEINADSYMEALQASSMLAKELAQDHLTNPETGLTTVSLLSLVSERGEEFIRISPTQVAIVEPRQDLSANQLTEDRAPLFVSRSSLLSKVLATPE